MFKWIALFFLIVFLIRLINPSVLPYVKRVWLFVKQVMKFTISLLFNSLYFALHLLIRRTVYVIGTVLICTILFTLFITIIVYGKDFSLNYLLFVMKHSVLDIYVFNFFTITYLLGMIEVLTKDKRFKDHIISKIPKEFVWPKNNRQKKYIYDQETGTYRYDE